MPDLCLDLIKYQHIIHKIGMTVFFCLDGTTGIRTLLPGPRLFRLDPIEIPKRGRVSQPGFFLFLGLESKTSG